MEAAETCSQDREKRRARGKAREQVGWEESEKEGKGGVRKQGMEQSGADEKTKNKETESRSDREKEKKKKQAE